MNFGATLVPVLISGVADYLRKHPELIGQALAWAREHLFPDLAASIAKAVVAELPNAVDKLTDVIPGQIDDQVLDGLAEKIASRIDLGAINGQLEAILKAFGRLPFLGR